jgi:hypothetical protein
MWRSVFEALTRPWLIASSKFFVEVALISETFATDMSSSPSNATCRELIGDADGEA